MFYLTTSRSRYLKCLTYHDWDAETDRSRRYGWKRRYRWNYEKIRRMKWKWVPWHSVRLIWNSLDLRMKYTRRTQDRQKLTFYYFQKVNLFKTFVCLYVWKRQQGREYIVSDFSSQNCRRIIWYTLYVRTYIVLAWDWGPNASNVIYTFTPSKISFPSPDIFLSDIAKHQARQINRATKNKNPTR